MADSISATKPKSETLLWLANQLRERLPGGVAAMKRASPVLGGLAGSVAAPALESVARGMTNYAYGDEFFHGRANEPVIGPRQEDMLAALPVGAGATAASKAMLVPARILRDKKTIAAADMDRLMGRATPEELWRNYQLLKNPKRPKDSVTTYLTELDDSQAGISPNIPRMSEALRRQTVQDLEPMRQHGADLRTSMMDLPAEGDYALKDFLQHPELFKNFPELEQAGMRVRHDPTNPSRGQYNPKDGSLELNTAQFFGAPVVGGQRGPLGTVLHEGTHALQDKYDMPGGASPEIFKQDPEVWRIAAEGLRKRQGTGMNPETERHWKMLLDAQNRTPFQNYQDTPGELFARAAQHRLDLSPAERALTMPGGMEGIDDVVDPKFANSVLGAARHIRQNPEIDPTNIYDWLKTWKQSR